MFVQIFCVLITEFMSLLFPIVVCVSYLLLSRCLTVIKLILDNRSIPLSVCHYCLLIPDNLSILLSVCHYCLSSMCV